MRDFKQMTKSQRSPFDERKSKIRKLLSAPIKMEVDLDSRRVVINEEVREHLNLDLADEKIDDLIRNYVHPRDTQKLISGLDQAGKGQEKPIRFSFMKPGTPRTYRLEFRYEIVYVKYACTRLSGTLVQVRG
jgi:hypothetical protein